MRSVLKVTQDVGLLIARLIFGVVMIGTGYRHWSVGLDVQTQVLAATGLPEPQLFAWGAVILEIVGGMLMVFGILTPVVAAFFTAEFVMVLLWVRWRTPLTWEVATQFGDTLILIGYSLIFVVFGAGRAAVDNLFRRPRNERSKRSLDDTDPA